MENNLESRLLELMVRQLEKSIHAADLVSINYQERFKLPSDFIAKAWSLVDQDSLLQSLSVKLQDELVDRLVNQMAAEIATDIKQILSVQERREAVRSVVRDNIDKLTKVGK